MRRVVMEISRDLQNIVIMALRYALGRKTYVTDEVPKFIMEHPDIVDERVCIVMIRDIDGYLNDKKNGLIHDDSFDTVNWLSLQTWLFQLGKEKGYNLVGYERR